MVTSSVMTPATMMAATSVVTPAMMAASSPTSFFCD
jgi:hypothetical protein